MAFYIGVTDLLATFGTPLTVRPVKSEEGKWINGQWQASELDDPIEVSEPFLPLGQIGRYANMIEVKDTGKSEKYEMMWISSQVVKRGTLVINKSSGKEYYVHDSDVYTDYSEATVYYLKSENVDAKGSDNNG